MENPFHPPHEIAREASSAPNTTYKPHAYVIASTLWAVMAVMLAVAVPQLRSAFADFEIQLSLLTRVLLHPMATVFFFAIAAAVIASGAVTNTTTQRQKTGSIALVIGIIAAAFCFFGLALPILQVFEQLS